MKNKQRIVSTLHDFHMFTPNLFLTERRAHVSRAWLNAKITRNTERKTNIENHKRELRVNT